MLGSVSEASERRPTRGAMTRPLLVALALGALVAAPARAQLTDAAEVSVDPPPPRDRSGPPPPRDRGGGEGQAPIAPEEVHWASYVIGIALVAGGIAALITPIWTLAEHGSPVPGDGREYVRFGPISGALLGIGASAIIGGIVMMIVGPIRATVSVSPTHGSLMLDMRF